MDFEKVSERGGFVHINPNYNPKSKKYTGPAFFVNNDPAGASNSGEALANVFSQYGRQGKNLDYLGDPEKYADYGVTISPVDDLDKELANAQGAFNKFKNAIAQAAISEVALGTVKGVSDLVDVVSSKVFGITENNYTNPVSEYLAQLQEDFRNWAPIYADQDKNIFNGGLVDAGWWASNLPSVMSSLTLMIPSTGITKGLGWAGKALNTASKGKLGAFGRNTYKVLTGAGKAKTVEEAEKLNRVTKWLNDTNTMAAGQRMAETGFNAALMRTMENYQEANQVYNDMKTQALDKFNTMTDEEYAAFVQQNANRLEGVDTNDKEAVANKLAKESADRTFLMDYLNTIFDVIQLNALRNPIKLLKNMRSNAAIEEAQRASMSAIGKGAIASTEVAAEKTGLATTAKNFGKGAGRFLKDSAHEIWAEASEGVEEAVNYIAQEEGMHYGNIALGEDIDNGFTSRLGSYMRSPELYDAAFWGVLGGVVFQGLGSGLNRVSVAAERAYQQNKKKAKGESKEGVNLSNFQELFETSENKRRIADIEARSKDFNDLVTRLKQIEEQSIDPFNVDENNQPISLETETEKTIARERAISEYITGMTFRAMDNGNFDMLKAYLQDSNIRQALEEATGNENDGGAFINSVVARMDHIADRYSQNLIALSNISRNVNIARKSTEGVIPLEYLQIIARDNTAAQIKLEDIDARIATYETSAANKKAVYGDKLDKSLNYKDTVQLVVLTQQLASLRAKKAEIEKDKNRQGIGRQIELDRINKNIDIVENMIKGSEETSNSDALTKVLYSTIQSDLMNDKDAYIADIEALARGDVKAILGESAKKFKTTDEEIMKVLGEDRTSGAYKTLATDVDSVFEGAYGLNKIDKRLGDDYVALAGLNIEKAVLSENVVMNEANLQKKVNELHNEMQDARSKAVEQAGATIRSLAKTYGRDNMGRHLETGDAITWNNEADKKQFDDALEVLNLTAASNQQLYDDLQGMLMMDELIDRSQEAADTTGATQGETNPVSQNQNGEGQTEKPNNQSAQSGQTATAQGNTLNPAESGQGQQAQGQSATPTSDTTSSGTTTTTAPSTPKIPNGATPLTKNYTASGQKVASMEWTNPGARFYNENGTYIGGGSMTAAEFERLTGVNPTNSSTGGQSAKSTSPVNAAINNIFNTLAARNDAYNHNVTEQAKQQVIAEINKIKDNPDFDDVAKALERAFDNVGWAKYWNNRDAVFDWRGLISTIMKAKKTSATTSSKFDDNGQPVPDANREAIKTEIGREIVAAIKQAKAAGTDATEAINAKVQELNAKYGQDEEFKKEINKMATSWHKRAKAQGLAKDVVDLVLLASSVTEQGGKYTFPDDFLKATKKFVDEFLREVSAKKLTVEERVKNKNNKEEVIKVEKSIVSFESMLRFANEQMEDTTTAQYIYNSLRAWFESGPDANKYIVLENMSSVDHILRRASMTDRALAEERLGGAEMFRVDIASALEHVPSKRAIDALNKGDKLTGDINDKGDIILLSDGVEVGRLVKPEISGDGGFQKTNNGWITKVSKNANTVYSPVRAIWEDILLNKSDINNKINSYIYQIIASRKIGADTKAIRNSIESDNDLTAYFEGLKQQGIVDKNTKNIELIDGLVSIWNYIDLTNPDEAVRKSDINLSLNLWFDKLYDSYAAINNALVVGVDKLSFTVAKISDGEVIQAAENDDDAYEKYSLGFENQAFVNVETTELGVIQYGNYGVIQTTNNNQYSQPNGSTGSVWAVLPNRGGVPGIVSGHSTRFLDSDTTDTPALRIRTAFANRCYDLIKNLEEENDLIELFKYLRTALDNQNENVPLFSKLKGGKFVVGYFPDDVTGSKIKIADKISKFEFHINLDSRTYTIVENGSITTVNSIDDDTFKLDFRNKLLSNLIFNADYNYFNSDEDVTSPLSGFATRDANGNFVITIPNGTSTPLIETFPSFKHFLMQGGGARWNIKVENGSNFRPRSTTNQLRNQVLNVSIESAPSLPVEEIRDSQITIDTINNGTAIDTIIEKYFGKNSKAVKRLKDAGLIPSEITYTTETLMKGDHPSNIWSSISKKKIYVNDEFIKMMNDSPEMAIRKLIHEQLHLKLHSKGNQRRELLSRIQEIVNDFKAALDNDTNADPHLREYLFEHIGSNEERLEEFLVESLTNRELTSYLNSVKADVPGTKTKKSLLNKILDLLADIFNWGITEGSLYEKELKVLEGFTYKEIEESTNNIGQAKTLETLTDWVDYGKEHITFDDNTHTYYIDGEPVDYSVTQYAGEIYGKPNIEGDYSHSSAIGRSMDAMYRDFFIYGDDVINRNYPNLNEARKKQILQDLHRLRTYLDNRFGIKDGKRQYTVITDEFPLAVNAKTEDGNKVIAGTMDMLIMDAEGNFHIFDFKAKNHPIDRKFNGKEGDDRRNYTAQQNMYRAMLETINPDFKGKVKSVQLIWMDTFYPGIREVNYFTGEDGQVLVDGTPIENYTGFGTPHLKENIEDSIISLEMTDNIEGLEIPKMSPITEQIDENGGEEISIEDEEVEDEFDEDDMMASSVSEIVDVPMTEEMKSIRSEAMANGTYMQSPSGFPSNLPENLWLYVRTKEFKDWFGDWVNDPANASKVVDENGEPKVVFRGINDANADKLFAYYTDSRTDARAYAEGLLTKGGAFFANNKDVVASVYEYLYSKYNLKNIDLDYISNILSDAIWDGEMIPEEVYIGRGEMPDAPWFEGTLQTVSSHPYTTRFTEEEIEQAQHDYDILTNDEEAKELLAITYLINRTTFRTESDLMRQYDDPDYFKDLEKLNKLLEKYNDILEDGRSKYKPNIQEAFLNIKNPYMDESHSEDLLDNFKAYRNGHDGAFLLDGQHFLVKKGNQVKDVKDASDTRGASVEERTTAPSVNQFVESLPLEERVNFSHLLLDGTISMKCS